MRVRRAMAAPKSASVIVSAVGDPGYPGLQVPPEPPVYHVEILRRSYTCHYVKCNIADFMALLDGNPRSPIL
jgi:hypothetical protein